MAAVASLELVPTGSSSSPTGSPPSPKPTSPASAELVALRGARVFASLSTETLLGLVTAANIRRLGRRAVLESEGHLSAHVYLVLRGRFRAVRRSNAGREVTVESYRPGDLIADAVLAPEQALPHDLEATESSEVLAIEARVVSAKMAESPSLTRALAAHLHARLTRSHDLVVGLALSDVPARVVSALKTLARVEGVPTTDGVLIRHRPTQQELANSIGACRETVSRIVSDMARRGLVTPRGRSLVVARELLDQPALRGVARPPGK